MNEQQIENIRLTIDDKEDFELSKTIYQRCVDFNSKLSYIEIVNNLITESEKELMINQIYKNIK